MGVGKRGTSDSQGHSTRNIKDAETHKLGHVIKFSLPPFVLVSFLHPGSTATYHDSDMWRSGNISALIILLLHEPQFGVIYTRDTTTL